MKTTQIVKNKSSVPTMVPWAGVGRGLSLLLDQHSDKVSAGTVSDDFKGQ